jgi:hypothetical protein
MMSQVLQSQTELSLNSIELSLNSSVERQRFTNSELPAKHTGELAKVFLKSSQEMDIEMLGQSTFTHKNALDPNHIFGWS